MKKLIFGLAAILTMSFVMAACGDNKKSKKDKDNDDEDERTESRYDDEDDMDDMDDEDMDVTSFGRSNSPEEQMMDYMEDMVDLLRDTHVKSVDDVMSFAKEVKKIQQKVEDLQKSVGEDYESTLSEEEQKKMEKQLEELTSQIIPELQRIQKEAEDAGLSGSQKGFDRVKGDQMGMCATVINSLALSSALDSVGVKNKVLTAIRMEPIGEFYSKWRAIEAMEQGYVCIFSAGTGSPYFTTDTGSSLRGVEIEADVMLKGTRVDGVYTADPEKDPKATKFHNITYKEVLSRGLKVMDLSAICMCQDNNLPIYVFNMDVVGNLMKVMQGEEIGTLVHP